MNSEKHPILVSEAILNDVVDSIVDGFRKRHPKLGELELNQLIYTQTTLSRMEIANSLRRTKP